MEFDTVPQQKLTGQLGGLLQWSTVSLYPVVEFALFLQVTEQLVASEKLVHLLAFVLREPHLFMSVLVEGLHSVSTGNTAVFLSFFLYFFLVMGSGQFWLVLREMT